MIKSKIKVAKWALSIFIFATTCLYSQNISKNNVSMYKIHGTIKGDITDSFAYLYYNNVEDSVTIANNNFEFKGIVSDTVSAQVYIKSAENAPQFYLENNTIDIQISANKVNKDGKSVETMHIDGIKGSHSSQIQQEYLNFYQQNAGKKEFNKLLYSKLTVFLKKHRSHPFSGAILAELAMVNPILSKKELNTLYSILDITKQTDQDLRFFKKGIDRLGTYAVGKPFLDFELPDQNGALVHLNKFNGKIILIDFWASWCAPCRKKSPELIALKQQYSGTNFEIIGISRDKNSKQWNAAIEKDKLDWINLLDQDQKIESSLGIENIPYNYLIDEKGIIIGINLSPTEIGKILSANTKKT
ncbi:peroxiredoxin [Flavobacterium sp. 90]|uniref:TlpA disulfide reductase family protein n=1 Tax=unclassified Flavobacterium TaxID=196869 RepID=UPI000EB468D1|nr:MULTISPECIES: TlpA disulfide reductase family protein [unclassified Flavobacterium]RKR05069.1 peroxiredoxin [Flavobacterium sp. 81]TCK56385.1 peroxiredoxin [Flavobacterium sp. 90]